MKTLKTLLAILLVLSSTITANNRPMRLLEKLYSNCLLGSPLTTEGPNVVFSNATLALQGICNTCIRIAYDTRLYSSTEPSASRTNYLNIGLAAIDSITRPAMHSKSLIQRFIQTILEQALHNNILISDVTIHPSKLAKTLAQLGAIYFIASSRDRAWGRKEFCANLLALKATSSYNFDNADRRMLFVISLGAHLTKILAHTIYAGMQLIALQHTLSALRPSPLLTESLQTNQELHRALTALRENNGLCQQPLFDITGEGDFLTRDSLLQLRAQNNGVFNLPNGRSVDLRTIDRRHSVPHLVLALERLIEEKWRNVSQENLPDRIDTALQDIIKFAGIMRCQAETNALLHIILQHLCDPNKAKEARTLIPDILTSTATGYDEDSQLCDTQMAYRALRDRISLLPTSSGNPSIARPISAATRRHSQP